MKVRWMAVLATLILCLGLAFTQVKPSLAGFEGGDPWGGLGIVCDPSDPTCGGLFTVLGF
jgi:hypothetical protein